MMGNMKLCLLLLLSTYAVAQQEESSSHPECHLSKRFKIYKKYTYQYDAEIQNSVKGTSHLTNGPKVSCKVEIDVPQACSFALHTSECSLTEFEGVAADGTPTYAPAAEALAFQAAMEKNTLKFVVEGETGVTLYPDGDDADILNFKRGIISSLIVPVMEKEQSKDMATVHGICATDVKVNTREDIATDVTITRDLSGCDGFKTQRSHNSPLAIITGLQYPLSKLIGSTQICSYKFDNQKYHMTSATCTEKHIFLPFSNQNEYGISSLVKQTLTLLGTSKINNRVFDYRSTDRKYLALEVVEDKAPVQTSETLLSTFRELKSMHERPHGNQRASTFQRLVSELRGLEIEVLKQATTQMVEEDQLLTWQSLTQCGTSECASSMFHILKTFDSDTIEVDAAVYALGMMHSPTGLLVKDILEIAQTKQSKAIMYALSNVVRRHFQAEGQLTSEILEVYKFITSFLGADCAGDKELTFLTLRVVGNMGEAMEAADPNIKNTLLKCMRQPATTLSVQMAAIQAFRRMSVTSDVRSNIQRVALYAKGSVQKRLAAYLILMRKPETSDLEVVKKILTQDQNLQVRSFVASHVYNIIHSKNPEMHELGKKIVEVMQDDEVLTHSNYTQLSRNYKMDAFIPAKDAMGSSTQGSIIFDPSSQLPREVMLETTLNAFGYNHDFLEFGMEGKGFEPTVETLFGSNGFFPDTISKAMYWVGDKMPNKMNEVLQEWAEPLRTEKTKRQVPENIVREMVRNFNKLAKDLYNMDSPEAMAYLRIMGIELGYIKSTSELSIIVDRMTTYIQALKSSPAWITKALMSGDQSFFAHYIFMDNEFSLPTASGFPLKFALSGTFAPGVKGGLRMEPGKRELSFSPSMGVEFVTHMGVHIPKFVVSAVQMHTNMFHESSLNAKITMGNGQIKLSIPAPQGTTQLFRASNKLMMVSNTQIALVPDTGDRTVIEKCSPLISGINYCTNIVYSRAVTNAPHFPLNGESMFAVNIEPTGEVTEYTATFAYEVLNEGKEGRQKVDSLKLILRAEGAEPTEATATIKYNRNRNVLTTSIEIPDYDVEAGIKVGFTDSTAKGTKITIDITNKNIPQLSLIGRAKLQAMREALLEAQLIVPSFNTEATLTATIINAEDLTLELKSNIKLPETNSVQKITFQYADDDMNIQLKSDMDSEIQKLMANTAPLQNRLHQIFDNIMEHKVVKTDMKLRHIYAKLWEAYLIWMDKVSVDVPYLQMLRENIPEMTIPSMPERVFMNTESTFKYKFNKDRFTVTIPLPLGGKTSEDLRIPPTMATPDLAMPKIGLILPSKQFSLPTFSIPSSYDLSIPLLGMVEVSAKVTTNFYEIEAVFSGGNNTVNEPSYIASYKVAANSPVELLAFTVEGTAQIADIPEDLAKVDISSSLHHKLIDARFSIMETAKITDTVKTTGNYKIEASSPLGMKMSLVYTAQASISSEIAGDGNLDGSLEVGPMSASTTATQTFVLQPKSKEARAESSIRVSSPIFQIQNNMKATAANGELSFESNTNINNDPIRHTTKFNIEFKEAQFTFKVDSVTKANERMLRNQVDFSASMEEATIRIESQADDNTNRAFSLLAGSLNTQGLELNSDATINFAAKRASHKGTLSFTKDGLTTSCTTNAQVSSVTFENIFNGGIATSGATMSVSTKATVHENSAELKVEGRLASSEVYLNSMYKGDIFNANTRNRITFRLNEEGLNLSNKLIASLQEMKIENTDSLILTLKSLAINSESDNFLNENNFYKHNIAVDIHDFTAFFNVNNNLKIIGVNFINDAQMKAELYKMEFTGTLKGTFGEEELRHTYDITYVDQTATAKCSTAGKLLSSQMTQSSDLEIVGFSTKFSNEVRFKCPSLRLESKVLTKAEPFSVNVESSINSDWELNLFGKHSGQVNSILLLRAEPKSFSHKHECKASTFHQLNNGNSIETNFQNEITSAVTPQQQKLNIKMESKLNDHAFDQSLQIFNTPENIGIALKGIVSTSLLNKDNNNQEFAITSAVKYEKNSDSHFISLPFTEKLPALTEEIKTAMLTVKDQSIDLFHGIDEKYDIRATLQHKGSELRQVIEDFDVETFYDDVKLFSFYSAEMKIEQTLQPVRHWIDHLDQRTGIITKINEIYNKIDEILAEYKIEAMVGKIIDDAVDLMKQYKLRETMQSAASYLKSIDIKPVFNKLFEQMNELIKQLNSKAKEIIVFYYNTLADEVKQMVTDLSKVPCFGMLYGEFEIRAPEHTLKTTAELKNATDSSDDSQLTANLNSQFQSPIDLLAYTFDATAHLNITRMSDLSLTETVKANHMAFSFDHQGSLFINGASAKASAKTTAKATTEPYNAEFVNNAFLSTESGFSGNLETSYRHSINMPVANIFSEATMTQKASVHLESGIITLTLGNDGKAKYSVLDYSDDGTHKSDLKIVMNVESIKLTFSGATDSSLLKMKQKVDAETGGFTQITFDAQAETDTPFIKSSIAVVKGQIRVTDPMIELSVSHNAELIGKVEGTIYNSVNFKALPYEIIFDTKNKENTKLVLPFKLSGKVDLQNDMSLTLSPTVQQASWTGLARFNQYKYSHYINMANSENEIQISASVNGEADLNVLTFPVNIPKVTIPFINKETPYVERFSLWEDAGLKRILITPQQTLDMDAQLKYVKNSEMFNMEPILNAFIRKIKIPIFAPEFNAKITSERYSCHYLSVITLPKIQESIMIPVMGDLTYEFSLKTAMITMNTKAGILNQEETVAQFETRATSEFDIFNGMTSGSATLNRNSGMKLFSKLNVEHKYFENNYTGLLQSNTEVLKAVISNAAKVNLPAVKFMLYHKLTGNAKEGLTISVSSPSAGLLGLQLQSKSLSHYTGRLFGAHLSEENVDILKVSVAVMDSNRLNFQTEWNKEVPSQILLWLKEKVAFLKDVKDTITYYINAVYDDISKKYEKLESTIDHMKDQGTVMYGRAAEKIAAADLTGICSKISDNMVIILRAYQKNIQTLLEAAISFMRDTQFQLPGHSEKLSGLEVYNKISVFFADVIEEAITRVPEILATYSETVIEYIREVEVTIPGSTYIISGREMLDDFHAAFQKIQTQMITIVKSLGDVSFETIVQKLSEILKFSVEKAEELLNTIKFHNLDKLSSWISNVYTDAVNSNFLSEIKEQAEKSRRIIEDYYKTVKAKAQEIFVEMTTEQLIADIQAWIDSTVVHLEVLMNQFIETLKDAVKDVQSYVRVSDTELDIDIPLPFIWNFISGVFSDPCIKTLSS
ncbi:apolipoprotein B-100-like [Myxocyprinus asiaticus]|uniref:apolipoprotein B-100-like n=1 Tax=Myxocyprinus asiaticus TaxID=70543 RepID=UPI002221E056|nr:apolipoprotein B-100-like [Myxocyprinus asiaticus]